MSDRDLIRRHLAYDFTEPIRDPLWSHIYLSPGLKRIVATPQFQKLGGIRQLGPTYMVYPGATHTRLSHSLGVFYLARKMIQALVSCDAAEGLSDLGVRSFLCAALLHDLGHFPYAHSLKELPLATHEQLTARTILDTSLAEVIEREAGADPLIAAQIIDTAMESDSMEVAVYRNILSGVLDPDKLDYLTRDAYFCGVPYGVQDVDFIINKLRFHKEAGLVIDQQGLHAVENVLFSKYLMYRTIYWHKTVRIATAMIKKALHGEISSGAVVAEDLYGLDDSEFFARFSDPLYRSAPLISGVAERKLYKSVAEVPFDESLDSHTKLLDLGVRAAIESEMSREMGIRPNSVIIDVPEPVSFEVDLLLESGDTLIPFVEAGTVFSKDVVSGFSRSLRKIRVFAEHSDADSRSACRVAEEWIDRTQANA